jgi:hypothetical protein
MALQMQVVVSTDRALGWTIPPVLREAAPNPRKSRVFTHDDVRDGSKLPSNSLDHRRERGWPRGETTKAAPEKELAQDRTEWGGTIPWIAKFTKRTHSVGDRGRHTIVLAAQHRADAMHKERYA